MNAVSTRAGAGLLILLASASAAIAQRAVEMPSSSTAAPARPTATAAPPAGFPQSDFVYGGEFETHLQAEVTKADGTPTKGTVFDDSDLDLYGNYSTWLSLYGNLHLERNREDNANDYFPDRNSAFRSEGLTLRQLFAAVRPVDALSLYGGKIHPGFGSAWAQEPGNFYNFASDYEQTERIGMGAEYALPETLGLGDLRLSVETFFLDTSLLSTSLISMPSLDDPTADRLRRFTRDQFGPSNTGGFNSYTVALRGGTPERGLTYQISVTQEGTDDPEGRTEYGQSISLMYDPSGDGIPLPLHFGVTPFLEYAHFSNFAGIADLERHYVLAGLTFSRARWQLAVAGGLRQSEGVSGDTDHQQNVSLNYALTERVTVGAGVNSITVAGRHSWTFGPSLNYRVAF